MMPPVMALKPTATSRSASSTRPRSKCPHALGERAGQLSLNHRQLRVLEPLVREPEETITAGRWARINHSTREEKEAGTDCMNGMVRTMLLEKSPQENVNPTCRLARGG